MIEVNLESAVRAYAGELQEQIARTVHKSEFLEGAYVLATKNPTYPANNVRLLAEDLEKLSVRETALQDALILLTHALGDDLANELIRL